MNGLWKIVKGVLLFLFSGGLLGLLALAGTYLHFQSEIPSLADLQKVQLQLPLKIFSQDGRLIAQYGEKRREAVDYDQIPPLMIQAFIAAEDQNFFHHYGVDPKGLARALWQYIRTGHKSQGGSTITMQVARNYYLSFEKTFSRKIKEIFLALYLEHYLSKQKILEMYLNKIYLGRRAYGVKAAAQVYYGKSLSDLNLAEIAMIAGLPKAPSRYNPITNPERALQRRNYVIRRLLALGQINTEQAEQALNAPVTAKLHQQKIELNAPYLAEMVRSYMVKHYPDAYTGGYHVYTTVYYDKQLAAQTSLRRALEAYDRRHGWRGAEKRFDRLPNDPKQLQKKLSRIANIGGLMPAVVLKVEKKSITVFAQNGQLIRIGPEGLKWQKYIDQDRRTAWQRPDQLVKLRDLVRIQSVLDKKDRSYWRLAQIPAISGALIALDPTDGAIRALVGGYDYRLSKFNRAVQAKRQPGSGFKPIIYSAALEKGYTAATLINDAPVVIDNPNEKWRPKNYSGQFYGPTRLRVALMKSRNLVSIRLLRNIGIDFVLNHARRFGFDPEKLPHSLSLALGSGEVTPWQMARAYAVLANGGYLIQPYFVQWIEKQGNIIYEARPLIANCQIADCSPAPRTLPADNRYIMYSMMQDVIKHGTATRARVLNRQDIAGKTGTTNEQRDAWFNGYNQYLVAIVWTGFDNNHKLGRGEVGGRVALPAWIDFMKIALQDRPDDPPVPPDNIISVRIDPKTGLRVPAGTPGSLFEIFRVGHEPPMQQNESQSDPFASELF